jgi:hypothetical protein
VTKTFTAYRRAIGQYEPGRDFHALRHSFTTALEDAGVPRQFIDELTGHEGTGETSRYAKGASLKVLSEAVSRLDYGFDTAHLRQEPPHAKLANFPASVQKTDRRFTADRLDTAGRAVLRRMCLIS